MFDDMQKENLLAVIKQQKEEIAALKEENAALTEEIEFLEEQLYSAAHYPESEW